ncbi:hypothetical protein [Maridesulfovibrio sp.]|uniref:hypothetical protein n=1 Tax=Maridesulfovibrio sp. TaxID=2795000 RepID=UPI0029CA7D02|nr:hypothetical protein [Maridesulfovibrio sp.]
MPGLNCGLTLIEFPNHSGVFIRKATASFDAKTEADITGFLVISGEVDMHSQTVAVALATYAQYGGACFMDSQANMEAEGLRQGPDGAVPINFQREFY